MTDQELIDALVEKKVLKPSAGEQLLKEANLSGQSAEELLYSRQAADEVAVAKVKSELLGAPYKKIDAGAIPEELLNLIPKETSQNYRIVPLEKRDKMLVVGMLRPDDQSAREVLQYIARRERLNLGVYIVTPTDLMLVWRRYVPYKSEIDAALQEISIKPGSDQRLVMLEEGARSVEDAPIIKIVASTLRHAAEVGASDIHIEPQRTYLRIRFRVDGDLKEVASMPILLSQQIVSRVKVLSNLKLDETRMPQDGRFRTMIAGREIDFRVATFPTPSGEKVALRVLDPLGGLKDFKEIGLVGKNEEVVSRAIRAPFGMILISGPTGSGKSTTLYSMMQKLNTEEVNIVTLEDPVEYFMNGINQSQVKPEIGYTFASGLRQILRQDPDVIMVGEIRDTETASLSVNAALTGHIMLSTIHTNNSVGVIPRLIDLGVPAFLLPSAVNAMIAQRLVGRLCPNCRVETEASDRFKKVLDEEIEGMPPDSKEKAKSLLKKKGDSYLLYRPEPREDCQLCKGRGISGRTAIFEVFEMTAELGLIIGEGFSEGKLEAEAKRQGMLTLRQDGILKALEGAILLEEVLRETE